MISFFFLSFFVEIAFFIAITDIDRPKGGKI